MKRIFPIGLLLVSQALAVPAQRSGPPYPPQMDGARVETYKTVGSTKLNLYIFAPQGASNAPAIVFFFGGGWSGGSPQQFEGQCRYFAGRGMVAISATPDALVLFNPALVLAPMDGYNFGNAGKRASESRYGTKPENISPAHHIHKGAPPTIIFHGKADTTVPYVTAEAFAAEMKKSGNRCELVGLDGAQHGFFNGEPFLTQTLKTADTFLASLGWLKESAAR